MYPDQHINPWLGGVRPEASNVHSSGCNPENRCADAPNRGAVQPGIERRGLNRSAVRKSDRSKTPGFTWSYSHSRPPASCFNSLDGWEGANVLNGGTTWPQNDPGGDSARVFDLALARKTSGPETNHAYG